MTTTPAATGRPLFVTLPVADAARSRSFFGELGFQFNAAFSDANAACMIVSEQACVMLVQQGRFAELSKLPVGDPTAQALSLFSFGVDAREDVDAVAEAALAAGATEADGPEDHGFMYTRSFFDLDGHGWQVMWMNPAAA